MSKKKSSKKNKSKKGQVRTDFRKRHETRSRGGDLTRVLRGDEQQADDLPSAERVSGKGQLTRKRTIVGAESVESDAGLQVVLQVDTEACEPGRVLRVHGLASVVQDQHGRELRCATRGVLKSLSTDQRHVVVAGDRVLFQRDDDGGVIERIEPRTGVISRTSRGQQHVIVANVDCLLIIGSAAEPMLKPHFIDRLIVTAERSGIAPVICINKVDLIDAADLQPLLGVYAQLGYEVMLASATRGWGVAELKARLAASQSVLVGQSGVGKSSLLNAIDAGLALRVQQVSQDSHKGKHTTTNASLIPLSDGGFVVDTPGVRQFELWDVIPQEIAGYFRELRPYVSKCRFPDCSHTHEGDCAVKNAVADNRIDPRRYESYYKMYLEE